MSVSKTLVAVLAVLLVAGSGAAVTGLAQTDTGASTASVSDLEMDATLDDDAVAVRVTDGDAPVENASIAVEGEEDVTTSTDADGTATVDRSALTEDDESLEELEVEYEADDAEGELEYVVEGDSLTLVEETYEYDVDEREEEGEDAEDDKEDKEDEEKAEDEDDEESEEDEDDEESEEGEDEEDEAEDEEEDDDVQRIVTVIEETDV